MGNSANVDQATVTKFKPGDKVKYTTFLSVYTVEAVKIYQGEEWLWVRYPERSLSGVLFGTIPASRAEKIEPYFEVGKIYQLTGSAKRFEPVRIDLNADGKKVAYGKIFNDLDDSKCTWGCAYYFDVYAEITE